MSTMIQVISLPSAIRRRQKFENNEIELQQPWTYLDAHTSPSKDLHDRKDLQRKCAGRELSPGEIGCYSSHYSAWNIFLASNATQLVVLEDDVVVDWAYLKHLTQYNFSNTGIDFLSLFAKTPCQLRRIRSPFLSTYYHLVQYLGYRLGTQGYLLTRKGAQTFVCHLREIRRPIDVEMDRSWSHGMPVFGIFPSPMYECHANSGIGEGRFRGGSSFKKRFTKTKFDDKFRLLLYRFRSRPTVMLPSAPQS